MSSLRSLRGAPVICISLVALALAGCSDDSNPSGPGGPGGGDITVPQSWAGIWQITTTPAPGRGGAEVEVTPLCAGLSVEDLIGADGTPESLTCSGFWNDTAADVSCSGSGFDQGCPATQTNRLQVTRSGDQFTGTLTASGTYADSCGIADLQFTTNIVATRISSDEFGCDSNLDERLPSSWGGTWGITIAQTGGGGAEPRGDTTLWCPSTHMELIFWSDIPYDVSATGGFTDTRAEAFGSWVTPNGKCLDVWTQVFDVTRNGDSITGTMVQTVYTLEDPSSPGGTCTGLPQTTSFTVAGSRTDPDVSPCE